MQSLATKFKGDGGCTACLVLSIGSVNKEASIYF